MKLQDVQLHAEDRQREELERAGRDLARTSAQEQGLPAKITDPRVLELASALMRPESKAA